MYYLHNLGWKFFLAIVLHALFVVTELIFGLLGNSVSLIADAIHNTSDIVGIVIVWFGLWISEKSAPERFTFGLKKATVITAFINATLLMTSVIGIIWKSIARLISPEPVVSLSMIIVAFFGVLIHGSSAYLFMKSANSNLTLKSVFIHSCADAFISTGVVVAGAMIFFKGWLIADPIMSLIAASLIFTSAWRIFIDSVKFILLAVPDSINLTALKEELSHNEKIVSYNNLHIWPISVTEFVLSMHIIVRREDFQNDLIKQVSSYIKDKYNITHITIQMEAI